MSAGSAALRREGPVPLWLHPGFRGTLGAGLALAAALWLGGERLWQGLLELEFAVAGLLPEERIAGASWFLLPALGLGAGVLASLSPCVLPLVPLNVAYIGAADASGWRAASLSGRFVLGAALVLTALGLAGDVAGWLLIEQRGPVLIAAGAAMAYLGLAALELVPIPGAGRTLGADRSLGPVGAGAAFALVTSPCASPLLGAVLAASAATGVTGLSVASMGTFALGFTALVFAAGVFGGSLVRRLRGRSFDTPRASAAALLLVLGLGFAALGIAWF